MRLPKPDPGLCACQSLTPVSAPRPSGSGALAPELHRRAVNAPAAALDLSVGDLDDLHSAPPETLDRARVPLAQQEAAGPDGEAVDGPVLPLRQLDLLDPELAQPLEEPVRQAAHVAQRLVAVDHREVAVE